MNYREILKDIEPERLDILEECISEIQGRNESEVISIITNAAKKFSNAGRPITKDEQKALIMIMRDNLHQDQRKKFDFILGMMGIR